MFAEAGKLTRVTAGDLDAIVEKARAEHWSRLVLIGPSISFEMQDPDIGLCFRLPMTQEERYLVPEALPANRPYLGNRPQRRAALSLQLQLSATKPDPAPDC